MSVTCMLQRVMCKYASLQAGLGSCWSGAPDAGLCDAAVLHSGQWFQSPPAACWLPASAAWIRHPVPAPHTCSCGCTTDDQACPPAGGSLAP